MLGQRIFLSTDLDAEVGDLLVVGPSEGFLYSPFVPTGSPEPSHFLALMSLTGHGLHTRSVSNSPIFLSPNIFHLLCIAGQCTFPSLC